MAKQTSNYPIESFNDDWGKNKKDRLPQSGKQVREFLRSQNNKKAGAWYVHENTLYAFKDTSDRDKFINTLDSQYLLEGFDPVELGSGGGASVDFRITVNYTGVIYINGDNAFTVPVFIKSTITEDDVESTYDTEANLEAIVTLNGSSTTYAMGKIRTNQTVNVNITPYVADGASVRFRAYDDAGYSRTTTASWNVVRASMTMACRDNTWWAKAYVKNTEWIVPLRFNTNVKSQLTATLKDSAGVVRATKTVSEFTTNYDLTMPHPTTNSGQNGVYVLTLVLSCTDASITGLAAYTLEYNVFCVTAEDTNNYFLKNNVQSPIKNYTTNKVYEYAVRIGYGNPTLSITAKVDGEQIASTGDTVVTNGNVYTYNLALQLERNDDSNFNVLTTVKIGSATADTTTFVCTNNEGYAATAGANLLIRMDGRTNSEANRAIFKNIITGTDVTPTITGVTFTDSDGYVTETLTDGTLLTFFRVQAGGRIALPIQPLKMSSNQGRTFEIMYRVSNVLDPETTIIKCLDETEDSYNGLNVTPESVTILAPSAQQTDDQTAGTCDEEIMRLTVVVRPLASGAATVDNFSGIFIFLNGCLQKEFVYGKDLNVNSTLTLGSDDADFDLFAIRTYNAALTKQEVETNACNFQLSETDKQNYKNRNKVRENGAVNYNQCRANFNVIVFDCDALPARSWTKNDKENASVSFYHKTDSSKNFIHAATDFTWQGTTSHNYSTESGVGQNYKWSYNGRKMCAKANWASSMQSHKIALTAAYTDLAVKCGVITEDTRISILQEPAVGFWKKGARYTYIGLFTVGNDKGDKKLFGFDSSTDIALEGKDNEPLGTNYFLPWNNDTVTVDDSKETYSFCGVKAWEDSLKNEAGVTARFKPFYNFVYGCMQAIAPFDGTLAELQESTYVDKTNGTNYWLTDTTELYYYNSVDKVWKDSGIKLSESLVAKGYGVSAEDVENAEDNDAINELFKKARRNKFKQNIAAYVDVNDALYHQSFIEFYACTDNLAKNTYPYLKKCADETSRIKWRQDDLDSSLMTENQGKAYKKYCVEFNDNYSVYGRNSQMVWNGTQNQFWLLMRLCFETEYYTFMRNKFIPATHYGQSSAAETMFAQHCQHYFFDNAQNHFSEALYNECSRVRYEASSLEADYQYASIALAQNSGSAYYAEKKWLAMRYIYMCSKFTADNFASGSKVDVFTTRPYSPEDGTGNTFQITPAIYMYPSVQNGESVIRGERIYAGTLNKTWTVTLPLTQGDQEQRINGMSYIRSLGNMYKAAIRNSVDVNGKMLTELLMGTLTDTTNIRSQITSIKVGDAKSLRKVVLANLTTLAGVNDFSSCVNLRELYADNTKVTSVPLCEGGALQKLHLPSTITSLTLKGKKSVTDLQIAGGDNLISIDVEQCNDHVISKTMDLLTSIYS